MKYQTVAKIFSGLIVLAFQTNASEIELKDEAPLSLRTSDTVQPQETVGQKLNEANKSLQDKNLFLSLPSEIHAMIFEYLSHKDLKKMTEVCWQLNAHRPFLVERSLLCVRDKEDIQSPFFTHYLSTPCFIMIEDKSITDKELPHFDQAVSIKLTRCSKITPEGLSSLKNLTFLDLYSNNLGDAGAVALSHLTGLTFLGVSGNNIGSVGAQALSQLTGLTSLDLYSNRIGGAGAQALSQLKALTYLNVSRNCIDDVGAQALSTLTSLTYLNLYSNYIGDEGAQALSHLTNLTYLCLAGNSIGGTGAQAFSHLTAIIDLRKNKIGDVARNNLKQKGPNYRVRFY